MTTLTYQSETGAIQNLVLKHARDAFRSQAAVDEQWQGLNYCGCPDFARAEAEYERFAARLRDSGITLHYLPADAATGMDSLYTRDAAVVSDRGIILCNMGKAARRGEPEAQEKLYRSLGLPICGKICGEGTLEGGDVVWLDERTIAVGRGYRTNDEGIRQLRELLSDCIDELVVVPLPHWRGPSDVFHLMSVISPLDRDLALVYSPLLPVPFREKLVERGIRLVEVAEDEFDSMGGNVLALSPRRCLMLSGNPLTRARLEVAEVEVVEYSGQEISAKGCGGPTCLTRPLLRTV